MIRQYDMVYIDGEEDRGWGLVLQTNQLGGDCKVKFWEPSVKQVYIIWRPPGRLTSLGSYKSTLNADDIPIEEAQ